MGPNIYFPPKRPPLKLVRAAPSARVAIKTSDEPAPEAATAPTVAEPPPAAPAEHPQHHAVEEAWRKVHRASELLAAEQTHLRDELIALHAREADLAQREEAVTAREAQAAERERLIAAAVAKPPAGNASADSHSSVGRLTRAPMQIARSIFGERK